MTSHEDNWFAVFYDILLDGYEALEDTFSDAWDAMPLFLVFQGLNVPLCLVKRYWILPRIESYWKATYVTRERIRRRRVLDTLKDPILAEHLEQRLLKVHGGNKTKMFESIENLRTMAETEVRDEDETKGQEKAEAGRLLFLGTVYGSVLLIALLQMYYSMNDFQSSVPRVYFGSITSRPETFAAATPLRSHIDAKHEIHRRLNEASDCGIYCYMLQYIGFALIQCIDSYFIFRSTNQANRRSSTRVKESEPATKVSKDLDIEQPLLESR